MFTWRGRVFPIWWRRCVRAVAVLRQYGMISLPRQHHMYTRSHDSSPSDPSCLKCCNNCPINTPYVNCIMPRKQEAKTRNRHNLTPLLLPRGSHLSPNQYQQWHRMTTDGVISSFILSHRRSTSLWYAAAIADCRFRFCHHSSTLSI